MAVPVRMKPLLLLAHGTRTSKMEWDGYDALIPDAEVRPFDLPGHGERAGEPVTTQTVLEAFDRAAAEKKPGQKLIVAGHSLGGYMASLYAEHLAESGRDEIDALVLISTTGDPSSKISALYRWFPKVLPLVGFERMTKVANLLTKMAGSKADMPGPEAYEALADAWDIVFQQCGPKNLRNVVCPVTFINGQLDQMRIHVRRYVAVTRSSKVHLIRGATHVLPFTHREQLAGLLREVCRSV